MGWNAGPGMALRSARNRLRPGGKVLEPLKAPGLDRDGQRQGGQRETRGSREGPAGQAGIDVRARRSAGSGGPQERGGGTSEKPARLAAFRTQLNLRERAGEGLQSPAVPAVPLTAGEVLQQHDRCGFEAPAVAELQDLPVLGRQH